MPKWRSSNDRSSPSGGLPSAHYKCHPFPGKRVASVIVDISVLTYCEFQLLAYHLTVLRGFNVDQPRNLAKSVTTE